MTSYNFLIKIDSFAAKFLVAIVFCSGLFSCSGGPKIPDVSKVTIQFSVQRFDQDLMALKKDSVSWSSVQQLRSEYPDFMPIYFERIANVTRVDDAGCVPYIRDFVNDPDVNNLYGETQKVYGDFTEKGKQFEEAFRFYKYYFPKNFTPHLLIYPFGFNYAVVATDSSICIALDQYLGSDFPYYEHMEQYIRYRKAPAYLLPDAMRGWATTEFESPERRNNLLQEMIFQGKIQYFLDCVLPSTPDSIKIGYTADQIRFCKDNEYMIWSYFVENKLLYSKDFMSITKYCGEAPFSAGMPKESPGRTGIWTGWQIVRAYMKRNPKVTLEQLMNNHNYEQILELSRYNPKR